MSDQHENPGLWPFALQGWKRPQVEQIALRLQDRWHLPVCLLLTALWLGRRGLVPDPALASRLSDLALVWETERIAPLRNLRRMAGTRSDWADWKRLLQEAELEAEKLLLGELEALVQDHPLETGERDLGEGWLLLVAPDMASCEELASALGELRDAI